MADKLVYADIKYNTQFSLNYQLKESFKNPVTNDTVFIHYIGPTKPWHDWAWDYPISQAFMAAKNASPWKDTALLKPVNRIWQLSFVFYKKAKALILIIYTLNNSSCRTKSQWRFEERLRWP